MAITLIIVPTIQTLRQRLNTASPKKSHVKLYSNLLIQTLKALKEDLFDDQENETHHDIQNQLVAILTESLREAEKI